MKLFQKIDSTPMEPWTPDYAGPEFSIDPAQIERGSPALGDMLAWDAKNPSDRWLVTEQYMRDHYEEIVEEEGSEADGPEASQDLFQHTFEKFKELGADFMRVTFENCGAFDGANMSIVFHNKDWDTTLLDQLAETADQAIADEDHDIGGEEV